MPSLPYAVFVAATAAQLPPPSDLAKSRGQSTKRKKEGNQSLTWMRLWWRRRCAGNNKEGGILNLPLDSLTLLVEMKPEPDQLAVTVVTAATVTRHRYCCRELTPKLNKMENPSNGPAAKLPTLL